MKISNLLEITPDLEREILWTLRVAKTLEAHLKEAFPNNDNGIHYQISIGSNSTSSLTIYDRHEGELGFYTHDYMEDGSYELNFINMGHTPEADAFERAILKEINPRRYKLLYEEDSE